MLYLSLRFVHIIFMAIWIGALLFLSGDATRSLADPSAHLPLLRDRMARANRVAAASAMITVVTGVALIFERGGFGAVPPAIHLGLVTGLAMMFVGGGLIGRNARKIEAGLAEGERGQSLTPAVKQLAMGTMVFHALWLVTLALMVFRGWSFG